VVSLSILIVRYHSTCNQTDFFITLQYSKVNQQRRQLLKTIGVFFAGHGIDINAANLSLSAPSVSEQQTLSAFLDVLIPRDQYTGSATDLQVDKQVWVLAESSENFRRLLALGTEWLNKTDGLSFSQLSYEQQYKLITWMSESDWSYIPRRFYELVRNTALSLYYSQPEAWEGLTIDTPPQPIGYPPPWG